LVSIKLMASLEELPAVQPACSLPGLMTRRHCHSGCAAAGTAVTELIIEQAVTAQLVENIFV
jgi:hypothetical protein